MEGRTGRRIVAAATMLLLTGSLLAACARAPADFSGSSEPAAETPLVTPEPVALRASLPRFDMVPGVTLRETLERWGAASGWTVRWASDRSYPIKGRATFAGDFVQAAGDLIRSFRQLNPPPIARFYLRNHELRVVTPGDEMGE